MRKKLFQGIKQKRSVLIGWTFSYIIILLIPVVTIVINYFYYVHVIRDGISRANELVLDNLSASVDGYLEQQIAFYSYVYMEDDFYSVMSNPQKNAHFYTDSASVKTKINLYGDNLRNISCFLYLPEKNYVIYSDGANDCEKVYNTYRFYFREMVNYDEWMGVLEAKYKNEFIMSRFVHHKTEEQCLTYATSIVRSEHMPINIFISIPVTEIAELASSMSENLKFVVCIDGDASIAVTNKGVHEIGDEIKSICGEQEKFIAETENYIVIKEESFHKDISYFLLIPQEEVHTQLKYVQYVFALSVILTLAVGAICAFYLVKWNFKPMSNLLQKMLGNIKWSGNEYKWIEKAYFGIIKEKDAIRKQITDMKKDMDCNNLLAIMKGRSIEKGKNIIAVEQGQKLFLVGFMLPFYDDNQVLLDELVIFTVENIFTELMVDYKYYKIEDGQYLSFLFLVNKEEEQWRNVCVERTEFVCDFMYEKWNVKTMAVVFEETDEIGKLRYLYKQMVILFESGKLQNKVGVVDCQVAKTYKEGKSKLVENIKDYIKEHYTEPELNVNIVADALDKNPRYISKIFKDEMKEGIPEYINRLRIKYALMLMQTEDLKIDQIISMSGYVSMATFRRSFIKYTGMTPGKYVENWKNEFLNN